MKASKDGRGTQTKLGRWPAVAACVILGAAASLAGYHVGRGIAHVKREGEAAQGTVVGIRVGVKGLRAARVRYETVDGEEVEGIDLHQTQLIDPNDSGESVGLLYDPADPRRIVVDRGGWEWFGPAFLAFGALMCFGLAVVFARSKQAV